LGLQGIKQLAAQIMQGISLIHSRRKGDVFTRAHQSALKAGERRVKNAKRYVAFSCKKQRLHPSRKGWGEETGKA